MGYDVAPGRTVSRIEIGTRTLPRASGLSRPFEIGGPPGRIGSFTRRTVHEGASARAESVQEYVAHLFQEADKSHLLRGSLWIGSYGWGHGPKETIIEGRMTPRIAEWHARSWSDAKPVLKENSRGQTETSAPGGLPVYAVTEQGSRTLPIGPVNQLILAGLTMGAYAPQGFPPVCGTLGASEALGPLMGKRWRPSLPSRPAGTLGAKVSLGSFQK